MGATERELTQRASEQRAQMGDTLEAIGDRLSPERIVERRKAAVGQRVRRVKETVMGSPGYQESLPHKMRDEAGTAMRSAAETAQRAPNAIADQARGNPIAVGIVAFGAGMLLATVMPKSETEARIVQQAQPQLQGAMDELKNVGGELMASTQEHARDAGEQLKQAASGAAANVKDQAKSSTQEVSDSANS